MSRSPALGHLLALAVSVGVGHHLYLHQGPSGGLPSGGDPYFPVCAGLGHPFPVRPQAPTPPQFPVRAALPGSRPVRTHLLLPAGKLRPHVLHGLHGGPHRLLRPHVHRPAAVAVPPDFPARGRLLCGFCAGHGRHCPYLPGGRGVLRLQPHRLSAGPGLRRQLGRLRPVSGSRPAARSQRSAGYPEGLFLGRPLYPPLLSGHRHHLRSDPVRPAGDAGQHGVPGRSGLRSVLFGLEPGFRPHWTGRHQCVPLPDAGHHGGSLLLHPGGACDPLHSGRHVLILAGLWLSQRRSTTLAT